MDKETEKRLKKKIMAGEELTEEEKKYFVNYDEWKRQHDIAHQSTVEGLRWNAWPILFICAFFLISTAVSNIRYLNTVGWVADSSTWTITVISVILGAASVVGAFWMKHKAYEISQQASKAVGLIVAEQETAAQTASAEPAEEAQTEGTAAETLEEASDKDSE